MLFQVVSRIWQGYVVGLAAVGLTSLVIGLAERYQHIANISMLYLIVVLAIAVGFGRDRQF